MAACIKEFIGDAPELSHNLLPIFAGAATFALGKLFEVCGPFCSPYSS